MSGTTLRTGIATAAAVAVVALLAGCGGDDGNGGDDVTVTLGEWIVDPEPTSVGAGEVTFEADNGGGLVHELVVVDATAPEDLPTTADGAFDENAFGADGILGEVEDVGPGDAESLTLGLDPGNYVLLCNIVDEDGEPVSHFANGMATRFVVTE